MYKYKFLNAEQELHCSCSMPCLAAAVHGEGEDGLGNREAKVASLGNSGKRTCFGWKQQQAPSQQLEQSTPQMKVRQQQQQTGQQTAEATSRSREAVGASGCAGKEVTNQEEKGKE